jgi:hypothetical protein
METRGRAGIPLDRLFSEMRAIDPPRSRRAITRQLRQNNPIQAGLRPVVFGG